MRVNAANDIDAYAQAEGNGRIRLRIGVHRYTATAEEALDLARQLIAAAEAVDHV